MRILTVTMRVDAGRGGGLAERSFQLARAFPTVGGADLRSDVLALDIGVDPARVSALRPATLTTLPCVHPRFGVPSQTAVVAEKVRDADVVHLLGHWTPIVALAYLEARRAEVPFIFSPCGSLPVRGRSRLLKHAFNRAIGTRLVHDAAAAIAVTDAERADFATYGVDPAAVHVAPNGVDSADHASDAGGGFVSRMGLDGRQYLLFLGRLSWIKGVDLLVEAFAGSQVARSGNWCLVFAGPDEGMRSAAERAATEAGLADRVRWAGLVTGRERTEALRRASLLVVPSRHEAMSIVALEAGINGTPVLLTRACGFDEVQSCGGGLVVDADAAGLAAGLDQLLVDPDGLRRRGQALRETVAAHFTWEASARRHLDVFASVMTVNRGLPGPTRTSQTPSRRWREGRR